MIEEAIVLAGGLGTRLREAVPDLPKCMAPVAGRPFLQYVIDHFELQGIKRFVFSLGYKFEVIEEFLEERFRGSYTSHISSIETEPLGTGGAIRKALSYLEGESVLVLNGDTFFAVELPALSDAFETAEADCTLALKEMTDFSRYGLVGTDDTGRITRFREKQHYASGTINGGVYALNAASFAAESFGEKFSFEADYLERFYQQRKFTGLTQAGYFIDIGIPEDYARANAAFVDFPQNLR